MLPSCFYINQGIWHRSSVFGDGQSMGISTPRKARFESGGCTNAGLGGGELGVEESTVVSPFFSAILRDTSPTRQSRRWAEPYKHPVPLVCPRSHPLECLGLPS